MAPVIQKFLFEGSSLIGCGRNMDSLIGYLDKNMLLLKEKLNEANFEKVLSIIWESSAKSLSDTIHVSIEVGWYFGGELQGGPTGFYIGNLSILGICSLRYVTLKIERDLSNSI